MDLRERPNPDIRPHDLLVEVRAPGVNRADLSYRKGAYGRASFGDSYLMGLEIAGNVIGLGTEVRGFAEGARVMGIVGGGGTNDFVRAMVECAEGPDRTPADRQRVSVFASC